MPTSGGLEKRRGSWSRGPRQVLNRIQGGCAACGGGSLCWPQLPPCPEAPGAPSGAPADRCRPVEPVRGELCKMARVQAAAWDCQQAPRPGPRPPAARAHATPVTMGERGTRDELRFRCVVKSGGPLSGLPQIQGPGWSPWLSGAAGFVSGACGPWGLGGGGACEGSPLSPDCSPEQCGVWMCTRPNLVGPGCDPRGPQDQALPAAPALRGHSAARLPG